MSDRLTVRYQGTVVGELTAPEGRLAFEYSNAWRSDPKAFPLSPRLPLANEPQPPDEVTYFFANLLPEGPILDALSSLRRLPRSNLFRLLAEFGRECAGAFEITSPDDDGAGAGAHYLPYPPQQLAEDLDALRRNVPLLHLHGELRLSMAGAQNKIPVHYIDGELFLPAAGAASTWILKPALEPTQFPDSVANEAACMRLAKALGLDVPRVEILEATAPVLLVERYDREMVDGEIRRTHQLDFCQLAGLLPAQKYQADGGPGFPDIFRLVDEHTRTPALERLKVVDWLVFNYLIGNADAHAKNLSIHFATGPARITPLYDLLSTIQWPGLSDRMAMKIGTEDRPDWVMSRHWKQLAEETGLNLRQLRRRALALADNAVNALPEVLDGLSIPSDAGIAQHLCATLEKRRRWIEQRIGAPAADGAPKMA